MTKMQIGLCELNKGVITARKPGKQKQTRRRMLPLLQMKFILFHKRPAPLHTNFSRAWHAVACDARRAQTRCMYLAALCTVDAY